MLRAFPVGTTSRSVSSLRCEAVCITTLQRRNSRKVSTTTRPGFGPRGDCSPSPLKPRHSFPRARIFQDLLFGPLGMKHTLLPANTSNTIPELYSHGYLYGSSSYALVDAPYPADLQAAAKAGTLKPNDDTEQNPSYAYASAGAISPP